MKTDKIIDALHTQFFERLTELLDTRFYYENILEVQDKIELVKQCKESCEEFLEDLYEERGKTK